MVVGVLVGVVVVVAGPAAAVLRRSGVVHGTWAAGRIAVGLPRMSLNGCGVVMQVRGNGWW